MEKINTNKWKPFPCKDLFECKNTGNILSRDVVDGSGHTPYVTASGYNNGVVAHIDASRYGIIKGNCILIGGKTFIVTYQADDFVSNDSHNFTIRAKEYELNEWHYKYLVTIINSYFGQKYSWGDAVTKDKFLNESIPLPTMPNGEPDWTYMESFMRDISAKVCKRISKLETIQNKKNIAIDVRNWSKFHLYDIFEISMGNKFDRSKMQQVNPSVNFIGRSGINNGVACEVDLVKDDNGDVVKPYNAGDITIAMGGSIGSAFVQESDFYTSQNVCVLHTINPQITFWAKQFIATAITTSCSNYEAFVDELNRHIKTDFVIYLPITVDGSPDYEYMDKYMQKVHGGGTQLLQALTNAMM